MALNGRADPNAHYPSPADAGNSITKHGFKITTRKLPILKAEPIERMTTSLGIAPPEMIFGDNMISIDHTSGWSINFNTYDALDRVDKTGDSMLQVAHSREWQSTRVMPQRLLLLCRFFMRLDGVILRIRDTRVYVEFGTGEVIREYVAKEEKYEVVRQVRTPLYQCSVAQVVTNAYQKLASRGQDVPAQLRDPNNLNDLLPVVEKSLERLVVS
ncbi:type 2A phosphatase activator TIP41, partial [Lecanoromycetidae sp. Uapishka_2]